MQKTISYFPFYCVLNNVQDVFHLTQQVYLLSVSSGSVMRVSTASSTGRATPAVAAATLAAARPVTVLPRPVAPVSCGSAPPPVTTVTPFPGTVTPPPVTLTPPASALTPSPIAMTPPPTTLTPLLAAVTPPPMTPRMIPPLTSLSVCSLLHALRFLWFAVLVVRLDLATVHLCVADLQVQVDDGSVLDLVLVSVGALLQQVSQQPVPQLTLFPLELERSLLLGLDTPQLLLLLSPALLQLMETLLLHLLLLQLLLLQALRTHTHTPFNQNRFYEIRLILFQIPFFPL